MTSVGHPWDKGCCVGLDISGSKHDSNRLIVVDNAQQ